MTCHITVKIIVCKLKKSLTRYVNIKQYIVIIFLILFYKMYEYHNNYNVAFELLYPNYLPNIMDIVE
jgi:hypothetical protein